MTTDPHETFWGYKAPAPPQDNPYGGPRDEWESLSPGMRREVRRQFDRDRAATHSKDAAPDD